MNNLDRFEVTEGYSIGSILPPVKEIIDQLERYHPPRNSNPNLYKMVSTKNTSGNRIIFKDLINGWSTDQKALFGQMAFKNRSTVDPASLELVSGTTRGGYNLYGCIMTRYEYTENTKQIILYQETLFWKKGDNKFNTMWFWRPK